MQLVQNARHSLCGYTRVCLHYCAMLCRHTQSKYHCFNFLPSFIVKRVTRAPIHALYNQLSDVGAVAISVAFSSHEPYFLRVGCTHAKNAHNKKSHTIKPRFSFHAAFSCFLEGRKNGKGQIRSFPSLLLLPIVTKYQLVKNFVPNELRATDVSNNYLNICSLFFSRCLYSYSRFRTFRPFSLLLFLLLASTLCCC